MYKNIKGFTLAEALITLGVIATIATVIIPVMTRATVDRDTQVFRKAIYTIQTATYNFMNGNDYIKEEQNNPDFVSNRFLNNFTMQQVCENLAGQINTKGSVDCTKSGENDADWNFVSSDGIAYYNLGGEGSFNGIDILVKRVGESANEKANRIKKPGTNQKGFMRINLNTRGKVSVKPVWEYEITLIEDFTKIKN